MAGYAMDHHATVRWAMRPGGAAPGKDIAAPLFLAALAVCSLIALGFSLLGAWPVLPFAGLELGALGFALAYFRRHSADYEKIVRDENRLVVERRSGYRLETVELNPHWARLRLELPPGGGAGRLLIGSHGREIELARGLGEAQKRALAAELKKTFAL